MMEEEKLRMKEEQGSDYEDDDEQEEEEPVELDQLKKGSSVSSLKKSPSHLSCVSFENNNKTNGCILPNYYWTGSQKTCK